MHRAILALSLILGITAPAAAQTKLEPPTGSPAETGVTLTDIFDATLASGVQTAVPPRSFIVARMTAGGTVISNPYPDEVIQGLPGFVPIYDVKTNVEQTRDPASGLPTGRRSHKPLRITKRIDAASPLLMDTLTKNGTIDIEARFYRRDANGNEEHYFTITLIDATVSSHTFQTSPIAQGLLTQEEVVEFNVNVIIYEDVINSVIVQDQANATP